MTIPPSKMEVTEIGIEKAVVAELCSRGWKFKSNNPMGVTYGDWSSAGSDSLHNGQLAIILFGSESLKLIVWPVGSTGNTKGAAKSWEYVNPEFNIDEMIRFITNNYFPLSTPETN